jgi:hypothetical protein
MNNIDHTLISDDIASKNFVCELQKCKGACCVEGDAGAPLEASEIPILQEEFSKIKPFLSPAGLEVLETLGVFVRDSDGDYTTPCIDGNKACAFVVQENGIAQCGIEKAFNAGATTFQKPISCHLYPIRITKYPEMDVLNYDRWQICSPACAFGEELKVPVYEFLKKPLIRKYGEDWFNQLDEEIKNKTKQDF